MTQTMFSAQAFDGLMARYPANPTMHFTVWRRKLDEAADSVRAVMRRRDELRATGELAEKGVAVEVARLVDRDVRKHLGELQGVIDVASTARDRLRAEAAALPAIDPKDLASESQRREIRDVLRTLPLPERIAIALQGDPMVEQAIDGVPEFLVGLGADIRERVRERRIDRGMTAETRETVRQLEGVRELAEATLLGLSTAIAELAPVTAVRRSSAVVAGSEAA